MTSIAPFYSWNPPPPAYIQSPGNACLYYWPLLVDLICRKCDVLNRGFSGYTSAYNKLILPSLLQHDLTPKESIAAVVILLGSNDACLEGKDGRSLTLDEYVSNMNSIVSMFVDNGLSVDRIVVMTPPPINEEMWAKECVIKGIEEYQ